MVTKKATITNRRHTRQTPKELFYIYTVTGGPQPPRCFFVFAVFLKFIEFTAFAPKLRVLFTFFDFNVFDNFNEFTAFAPKLRAPNTCLIVLRRVIYTINSEFSKIDLLFL